MKKTAGDIIGLHKCSQMTSYHLWFLKYGARQTEFCPFTSLTTLKIKILGDIIILQMCTINGNHMMYGS